MYFSILRLRESGSGCWTCEWEEWISLHSAFISDHIAWPFFVPPCFLYGTHTLKYADKPLILGPVFSSLENKSPVDREVLAQPVCMFGGCGELWLLALTSPQTTLPQSAPSLLIPKFLGAAIFWAFLVFFSVILGASGRPTMNGSWLKRKENTRSGVK